MSYDLEVYGKVALTAKELAKVVSAFAARLAERIDGMVIDPQTTCSS